MPIQRISIAFIFRFRGFWPWMDELRRYFSRMENKMRASDRSKKRNGGGEQKKYFFEASEK